MRKIVALAVLISLPAARAAAQATAPASPPPRVSQAIGIHYGTPLRGSLSAGLLIDRNGDYSNDGGILMLEQGFQGSEVSIGYFKMFASFGSGYSVRAAIVRTADDPWQASPRTTYVGAEAHLLIVFGVGGRVGYLRRTSRSENDPYDTVISAGVSIGH